ncbi:hypothetical protein [Clostridium sp.]|uniref:hypothetical protein n=1 Tax=Clostridium sp. TaxID=1506 RepID=UPI002FDDA35B
MDFFKKELNMGITVLMITIGTLLIVLNLNAVIKEKKSFQYQLTVKQNAMEDYKTEIANIKKEFSEMIFKLQGEIESLRYGGKNPITEMMLYNDRGQKVTENIAAEQSKEHEELNSSQQERENDNNIKVHKIRELLKEGMSIDQISEKTGVDKGEVLLIKELYTE